MEKRVFLVVYILICFFLLAFSYAKAETIEGKVIAIADGNMLEVITEHKEILKLLFWGADCPNINQQYGSEARDYVADLLLRKKITFEIMGKDREGNRLAIIYFKGENINLRLIQNGIAWAELHYSKGAFQKEQNSAQNERMGLWQMEKPTPPWIFRRQQTMKMAKSH